MAFTVRVQNFQSLLDVTLDVDGFTVVTGSNNSGKSALLRAIRGAFQNTRGTSFIRHGTTKSVVTVDFGGGDSVVWEKGKGAGDKPTFTVGPKGTPLHPGSAVPDEVRALGVRPITAGGREIWPQFAPQFTGQVFLLDQPGSVLAEAVSDVARVTQLNEALRFAESDRRAAASELRVRLSDKAGLEAEAAKFDKLGDVETLVGEAEAAQAKVTKVGLALDAVRGYKVKLDTAQAAVDALAGVDDVPIPSLEEAAQDLATLAAWLPTQAKLTAAKEAEIALAGVDTIAIPLVETAQGDLAALVAAQEAQGKLQAAKATVAKLEGIPFPDMDTLATVKLGGMHGLLGVLVNLAGTRDRLAKTIAMTVQEIAKAEQDLANTIGEIVSLIGDMGECPTCGTVAVAEGSHAHG